MTKTADSPAESTSRILVVEDDAFIALDLQDVLSEAGYQVIGPVATVSEAIALLDSHQPDMALLDYNLGDETSIPVAHRLEARGVPFMFLSGQVSSVMLGKTRTEPKVMSKPFVPDHLVSTLGQLIN